MSLLHELRRFGTARLRAFSSRTLIILAAAFFLFPAAPGFSQTASGSATKAKGKADSLSAAPGQVVVEGELETQIEDHIDKTSRTRHYLHTAAGEQYELQFKSHPPHLPSGTKVRVVGAKSGTALTLDSGGSTSVQVVTEAVAPNTFGAQKTLVLLVNFQDQPTNKPWTTTQVSSFVFGTVSNFYLENSYKQTWLTGDVFGWYTLPLNSTTCDQLGIANDAKQAATAAGVNLSAYTRYVYLFPTTSACTWSGTASVGGNPSQAWVNGYLQMDVVGHEFGHNFGLYHSHSWSCTDGSIIGTGTACSAVEYGDGVDIMGWSSQAHFHAFQKEQLGWLNYGVLPPITTVTTSGTYTIEPYETTGSNAKALKILKGTDSYGYKTWYYVEYRQALGFDSVLTSASSMMNGSNILSGVLIHSGYEGNGGNTNYLLDMTSATYDFYTRDPALTVGQTFTDSAAGVTITTQWVNGANAGVSVSLGGGGGSSCTRAKPSVVMSPSQSASVAAGTPVAYTVAVTNNDSSACGSSSFNLQSVVPSGWSATLGSSALSISPGSAASTTLTVISSPTALAGSYSVGTTATNSAATSYSATGSATYSVTLGTTTTLTTSVSTDKASYTSGATVTITATATNGGTPVANASVAFTVTKPNGSVVSQTATTGASGQAVYKLRLNKQKDPTGVYQTKDVATSGGSSASAATSFSVQ